jgi:NitT/TauT family transport system permease protein
MAENAYLFPGAMPGTTSSFSKTSAAPRGRSAWFEPRRPIPRRIALLSTLLGFAAFLLLWCAVSAYYAHQGKSVIFASPWEVATTARDYLVSGFSHEDTQTADLVTLGTDLRATFLRVLGAFLLAAALGIPVGVLMGSFRILESFFQPLAEFVRYVPVPALIPVILLLFGIDESSKIVVIFAGTFFQLALMVADEIRRVPIDLLHICQTLGGTRGEVVRRVLVPAAMPGIFDTLRVCNGLAWTWVIVAELLGANAGLGFRIVKYQRYLQTDKIFLYLIVIGLIGLLLDWLFRLLQRALFQWADTSRPG